MMRRNMMVCIGAIWLLAVATAAVGADEAAADLRITRVALFKNGVGYFTTSATLPAQARSIKFGQLPVPSLGTFWVTYPEELKVRGLFTKIEDGADLKPVRSLQQLLAANIGRTVTLSTSGEAAATIRGVLLSAADPQPDEPPSPYRMGPRTGRRESYRGRSPILIRTDDGITAVRANQIVRARIEGEDIKTSFAMPVKKPSLRMQLDAPANGEKVELNYLARGITWSPSYIIDLSDAKTARMTAKAVVVNEAADLEDVQLELVTGFPHLRFADVNSPVAMSQSLSDFLKALQRGRSEGRRRSAVLWQQRMLANVAYFDEMSSAPVADYGAARAGAVAEDLFLYPVDKITLGRGETACLPLFTAEAPYKHVYIWKIPDALDERGRYRQERRDENQPKTEEVWHSCRLTNTMKMPWTTAPAQFIKNDRITGQDICYYTASGSKTTIRINRAMNVLAEQAEVELGRERNAATLYGSHYDLVKVKGELKLRNKLKKPALLEITKELSGKVLETTPEAKDTSIAKGLKSVNTRHRLVWELTIEPGKAEHLTYTYQVYIRR